MVYFSLPGSVLTEGAANHMKLQSTDLFTHRHLHRWKTNECEEHWKPCSQVSLKRWKLMAKVIHQFYWFSLRFTSVWNVDVQERSIIWLLCKCFSVSQSIKEIKEIGKKAALTHIRSNHYFEEKQYHVLLLLLADHQVSCNTGKTCRLHSERSWSASPKFELTTSLLKGRRANHFCFIFYCQTKYNFQ